ncbi:MAG: hypothetical protein ABW321_20795 [Polyangiales bacterium]
MGGISAMAKMNEITEALEAELDAEDELEGWGPVRVRRSSIPALDAPLTATPASSGAAHPETLQAPDAQRNPKRLNT